MNAAQSVKITGAGGPEVLSLSEMAMPTPRGGQVLVRVRAAGLNRADILQRKGVYPAPKGAIADVPGLEFAGEVEAVGDAVIEAKVGDRVMGITAGGAMATHVLVHERELVPVPATMDWVQAGAIPEVFMTAFDALFVQAGLTMGETVLVHAVGSGVGTAAVQLARATSAVSIGTSRTKDKLARCEALGMNHGVLANDGEFHKAVHAVAPGGADVVLDTIGAAYLDSNLKAMAPGGRMVTIGLLGGVKGECNLGLLVAKRLRLFGSVLRARPLEEKATLAQRFRREVMPLFASGQLSPVVEAALPMTEIAEAHRLLEGNTTFGKIVMTWP